MFMLKKFTLTLFAAAVFSVCGNAQETESPEPEEEDEAEITFCGSDFFAGTLEKKFTETASAAVPGVSLKSDLRGSRWALAKLREGKCDFAIALVPDKKSVPEFESGAWKMVPVAYQTAIVVVAKSNPLEQISFYQLRAVFARYAEERIERWNDIASGFDAITKIRPIVNSDPNSSLAAFFQSRAFPNSGFENNVLKIRGNDETLHEVGYNTIAVVSSFDPLKYPVLKMLSVSAADKKNDVQTAYAPSISNIAHGDYPFSVPFYFIYPVEKREKILPFLSVAVSDEFVKFMESSSLAVPPKNIRIAVQKQIQKYSSGSEK